MRRVIWYLEVVDDRFHIFDHSYCSDIILCVLYCFTAEQYSAVQTGIWCCWCPCSYMIYTIMTKDMACD